MSLWTKLSLYSLAGFPDFSPHQHNEISLLSPSRLIYFLQLGQDTSPVIIGGDKVTLTQGHTDGRWPYC